VLASTPPVVAIASTRRDFLAHLSPGGRRLTFISDRSGESEVWAADVSGANAVQLTTLGANPGFPRWSPDGQTIAFHSNAEDRPDGEVYLVPAEGGQVRNLTRHAAGTDTFASFSRDGQWVYFCSSRTGEPFVWKIPVAGGEAVKVSPTPAMFAVESTDRTSVFYVESATTNRPGPLWQLPLKGGNPVKLAENVPANSFDAIDAGVYYLEQSAGDTRLQFFSFATRRSTTVASKLGTVGAVISVSHDGRTIFYSRLDSSTDDLMLVENFR
jgi:Tol biopolymer transport system component